MTVDTPTGCRGESQLTHWLRIFSLPIGMVLIILFADTLVDLATWLMVELSVGFLVAFGIISFVIFFTIESLIP